MTIFYSDEEPVSKYSAAMLHLSPATTYVEFLMKNLLQ